MLLSRLPGSALLTLMSIHLYHFLHVFFVFLLLMFTFKAFADPRPELRRKSLMVTGILSLIVLVAGFGLLAKLHYSFTAGWVILKLVAWLGVAALGGIVFRQPGKAGVFSLIVTALVAMAVYAVYFKPF